MGGDYVMRVEPPFSYVGNLQSCLITFWGDLMHSYSDFFSVACNQILLTDAGTTVLPLGVRVCGQRKG